MIGFYFYCYDNEQTNLNWPDRRKEENGHSISHGIRGHRGGRPRGIQTFRVSDLGVKLLYGSFVGNLRSQNIILFSVVWEF